MMVAVTGVGSLPGTDFPAALRLVFDVLAEAEAGWPHLPELPARGPAAAMIAGPCWSSWNTGILSRSRSCCSM